MTKIIPHDIQQRVAEIVENTLNELQVLGMTRDGAARLLVIQGAIRLDDDEALHLLNSMRRGEGQYFDGRS